MFFQSGWNHGAVQSSGSLWWRSERAPGVSCRQTMPSLPLKRQIYRKKKKNVYVILYHITIHCKRRGEGKIWLMIAIWNSVQIIIYFKATMGVTGLGRRDDGACGVVVVEAGGVGVCGGGGSGFVRCAVGCEPKNPRRKTCKRFAVTCWKLIPLYR